MVKYNPMVVTNQGQKYMLEASNSVDNTIFSKVVVSDKAYAQEGLKDLTALDSIKLTVAEPTVAAINSTTISTIASFNNKDLTSPVVANTIGLYAVSNNDNSEFLYAISTAKDAFTFKAYVEADGVQNFNIRFNATLASQPEGGSSEDASSNAYVTIDLLNASEARGNTYTDKAIADLHLGGNNIIKGTEDLSNFGMTTSVDTTVKLSEDNSEAVVAYTGATVGTGGFTITSQNFDSHSIQPKTGDVVTMSYEAKGTGKYELSQKFNDEWYKIKSETVTANFTRYELTFQWQDKFTQLSFLAHPNAGSSLTIRHFKLELSPKATDWLSLPKDGNSNFIHVAYADDNKGLNFSLTNADRSYLGIYIDSEREASTAPTLYTWIKVRGENGLSGIDGTNGSDGKTSYVHLAYANSADGTVDFSTTDSINKLYMGSYVDFKVEASTDPGVYNWSKVRGEDGKTPIKGTDYFDGKNGQDGVSSYLWIRYAKDAQGSGMTTDPTGAKYVGYATTVTNSAPDQGNDYTWQLVVGKDGIPGEKGIDGKTSYLHIRYSDDNGVTFTANNGEDIGIYVGQYTDFTEKDSEDVTSYTWSRLRGEKGDQGEIGLQGPQGDEGIQGPIGNEGEPSYTHLAYANSADGVTDFSVSDAARDYVGMYTDNNIIDSENYADYNWSLIKGADGAQGTPGKAGVNGQTPYFHVAYADNATGTEGFSTTDSLNKPYIGQYTNFLKEDSTDSTSYAWTLIKGDKGDKGDQGEQGLQGPKGDKGIQGPIGADGKSSYTHIAYSNSADGTVDFSVSDSNRTYIGMYVDPYSDDSTDSTSYAWTLIKGRDGSQGTPGKAGADGETPYLHIAYATSADGSSGFSTTDSVGKTYIGQYTNHEEGDSGAASSYTWSLFKGDKGDKGDTGADGKPGKDGVGIKSTKIMYAQSNSGTTPPTTGWDAQVSMLIKGQYLWTQTTWVYTDNTSESGYTVSYNAKDGSSGKDGIAGKDGVGITLTSISYVVSSSGVTKPSTGWSATIPSIAPGQFLWTETMWLYTDGTSESGYSVSQAGKTGAKGDKGDAGKDGVAGKDGLGIKSTTITYQLGDSGTTHPTGTWSTNVPALTKGQYLWTRTTLTYTDSTTEQLYSVTYIAKDGNTGANGVAGKDGVGIKSTVITYQVSDIGTTPPTGTWVATPPAVPAGQFLWTRTVWTYTDGSNESGYSVAQAGKTGPKGDKGDTGADGLPGKDGVSVKSTVVTYQLGTSGTTKPTSTWISTVPTLVKGQYLWTKTTWNYSDSTSEDGYQVTYIGKDGNNGSDGIAGKDGTGIKSTQIDYVASTSGTVKPASGWQSTIPTVNSGQYLWTRTTWSYTDNTSEVGYSVAKAGKTGAKGDTGSPGKDGIAGKDGVGIKSTLIQYASNTSGTVAPTSGWTSSVPSLVKGQYLWTKTTWNYSDNTSEDGFSVAYIAKDGNSGKDGVAGKDGTGIKSTKVEYAGSTSGTTKPTNGWLTTVPSVAAGSFLWTKTTWSYTDGTSESGYSVAKMGEKGDTGDRGLQGLQGDTGNQGIQGPKGLDGKSSYTHIAYATSSTGSGFTQAPTATTTHVGMYVDQTATDSTEPSKYNWALFKGADGSQGTPGKAGVDGKTPYLHTAYSWSADGTDRFTTVYPGENLWCGTKEATIYDSSWEASTNDDGFVVRSKVGSWGSYVPSVTNIKDGDVYTFSVMAKLEADSGTLPTNPKITFVNYQSIGFQNIPVKEGEWTWIHYTLTFDKLGNNNARFESQYATARLSKYAYKVEKGLSPHLWTPSPLDDPDGAYPQFIGTYTDYIAEDSTDPSKYTWAKLRGEQGPKGDAGKDGVAGKDGKGIKATAITYQASTNGTTTPTGTWSASVPTVAKGSFLWTRTIWTYTDNTTETGYAVAYMGTDGNNGTNGVAGKDGVGIKSTTITYASSTSGTIAPTSGWTANPPATSAGQFIWTKTVWTYTDGTNETGYSVGKIGEKGDKGDTGSDGRPGKDGVGVKSTAITYALGDSGTAKPTTGWNTSVPSLIKGKYLWTKTVWLYTDNTSESGYSATYIGKDGNDGNNGLAGKDGVGIKSTKVEYAGSTSGTTKPTNGWLTTVPSVVAGSFLWTKTTWSYTDGTSESGYSVGKIGETGQTGQKGDTGPRGSTGATGPIGPQGPKGDPGSKDVPVITSGTSFPNTRKTGDMHWETDSSGKVIGYYKFNGNQWVVQKIDAKTIAAETFNGLTFNGVTFNGSEFNNAFDFIEGDYQYTGTTLISNAKYKTNYLRHNVNKTEPDATGELLINPYSFSNTLYRGNGKEILENSVELFNNALQFTTNTNEGSGQTIRISRLTGADTYDSGWKRLTFAGGAITSPGDPVKIRRIGKMVYLTGDLRLPETAGYVWCSIPQEFRPEYESVYTAFAESTGFYRMIFWVHTNGQISTRYNSQTTMTYHLAGTSWAVNEVPL